MLTSLKPKSFNYCATLFAATKHHDVLPGLAQFYEMVIKIDETGSLQRPKLAHNLSQANNVANSGSGEQKDPMDSDPRSCLRGTL